jgi:hypothetical protein
MLPEQPSNIRLESRLRLIRFAWDKGHQTDEIDFAPGLNLLSERDQTERTIILRLIRYAMGGSGSRIDDNIMRITREVQLEFLANGKVITTRRGFEHPTGKFQIMQEDRRERALSPNEMGEFLLEALEIPRVRYQYGERRTLLSFNDLARAFVVDRDFSYTEILSKVYPEPRREVVKLMLGLTTQEIANAEEEFRASELKLQRLNEEIRGIERLLSDFRVGTLLDIQQRRSNLLKLLDGTQRDEDALREKIQRAASQGPAFDEAQGKEEYQALRDELITQRARLTDIDSELSILNRQAQEKTDLKSLLESEVRKIERHATSQYVLSTFTFSRCPRCLRDIDAEMRDKEREGACMLCGRPLQVGAEFDGETWNKALADANKAVQEAEQLLAYYSSRSQVLKEERSAIQERVAWLQTELTRQTSRYVSPLVEDLSLINERRAQLLRAIAELDLEEKQRLYADDMRDKTLPELRKTRDQLQGKMKELQIRRGRAGQRVEAFLTHLTYFMRKTASGQFRSASWDESELLPRINDQEYTRAMSGFDLAISVLASHYALLALKVKPPSFDTAHPGLLIVDEPQQQMMEPHQYRSIMRLFTELADTYGDEVQIVVAATDSSGFEDYLQPIRTTTA